jgi:hypothetical protein
VTSLPLNSRVKKTWTFTYTVSCLIQDVFLSVSQSTTAVSHRKPASAGTATVLKDTTKDSLSCQHKRLVSRSDTNVSIWPIDLHTVHTLAVGWWADKK